MEIINRKLLFHPMNWVILFLMVFIAGIVAHFIVTYNVLPKVKAP